MNLIAISSTTTIYEEKKIWSRDYGTETYARTVDNPDYKTEQNTIKALTCASARLGMRGTFDFLWRFSGTDGAEAAEFHNSWYEIIESYSSRNLTRHEDKLMLFPVSPTSSRKTRFYSVVLVSGNKSCHPTCFRQPHGNRTVDQVGPFQLSHRHLWTGKSAIA